METTIPVLMLMCHKVTHKKLIDNSPLFRKNFKVEFHGSHTNCVAQTVDKAPSCEGAFLVS